MLEVNSLARLERFCDLLRDLGASPTVTGRTTVNPAQDMMLPRGQLIPAGLSREASQAWAEHWLNEEDPALKGRTPRQAALSDRHWPLLEALLRQFDGQQDMRQHADPAVSGGGKLPGCANNCKCRPNRDHGRPRRRPITVPPALHGPLHARASQLAPKDHPLAPHPRPPGQLILGCRTAGSCTRLAATMRGAAYSDSNRWLTHYEKPGQLLWGRYLQRSQHLCPGMHSAHSVFQILGARPGPQPGQPSGDRASLAGANGATRDSDTHITATAAAASRAASPGWPPVDAGGGRG